MRVKFFQSDDNNPAMLDELINNWLEESAIWVDIKDVKLTSQYILNSEYEGVRDTALVIYEELKWMIMK